MWYIMPFGLVLDEMDISYLFNFGLYNVFTKNEARSYPDACCFLRRCQPYQVREISTFSFR